MPDKDQKKTSSAAEVISYRVGELEKRFDRFEGDMGGRFDKFENKLDALAANFITHKEAEAILKKANLEHKNLDKRIGTLEATVKWVAIAIVGAVLTAILSLVIPGVNR